MAVTVDAATVALVTSSSASLGATTAAFDTPANCWIGVLVGYDASDVDAAGDKASVTNNKSLTVVEVRERGHKEGGTTARGGALVAWMYSGPAQTGMTVTVTINAATTSDDVGFKVVLCTGTNGGTPLPDSAEGNSTANPANLDVTSTTVDGVAFWAVDDWVQSGAPTWTGTGVTSAGTYDIPGQVSGGFAYKTVTATGTQTATYDAPGVAATELSWVGAIVLADSTAPVHPALARPPGRISPAGRWTPDTNYDAFATGPNQFTQDMAATLGFTGAETTLTAKSQTATLSFTGALTLRTARAVAATLSFTGSLATQVVHFFTQSFTAAVGFTSSLAARVAHVIVATLSFTGAPTRRTATTDVATLGFTSTQTRRTATTDAATLGFTGALVKRTATLRAATLSFTTGFTTQAVHFFTQAFGATLSFVGSLATRRQLLLTAAIGFTTTFRARAGKAFAAALSFTTAQSVRVGKRVAASLPFTASFTIVPTLLSALSDLRVRIFGREPGGATGRRPRTDVAGGESGGAAGREPRGGVSFNRNDGPIGGREDGTP